MPTDTGRRQKLDCCVLFYTDSKSPELFFVCFFSSHNPFQGMSNLESFLQSLVHLKYTNDCTGDAQTLEAV